MFWIDWDVSHNICRNILFLKYFIAYAKRISSLTRKGCWMALVNGTSTFNVGRLPLCGDVASNPGPRKPTSSRFPCKECGREFVATNTPFCVWIVIAGHMRSAWIWAELPSSIFWIIRKSTGHVHGAHCRSWICWTVERMILVLLLKQLRRRYYLKRDLLILRTLWPGSIQMLGTITSLILK